MIRVLADMPEGVLGFEAGGKLTRADYDDVLIPALEQATEGGGKIRILLDFSGEFSGVEPSAAWEDMKTGVRNWKNWERIALVTDHTWMRDGLRMFAWAVPGDVSAFPARDRAGALAWLTRAEPA